MAMCLLVSCLVHINNYVFFCSFVQNLLVMLKKDRQTVGPKIHVVVRTTKLKNRIVTDCDETVLRVIINFKHLVTLLVPIYVWAI